MTGDSGLEQRWLDYAWGVVACDRDHVAICQAGGGLGLRSEESSRFPGFVGPDFVAGRGVLCFGHVHRYRPDVDDVDGGRLDGIDVAISWWRSRGRTMESDASFLAESRAAYMSSAPTWPYWQRNFQPMLSEARVPLAEVAFTNVAKCRTPTEEDSTASVRLAKLCAKAFPPARVVEILRPAVVLLASLQLELGDVGDVRVIQWNGRTGKDSEGNTMTNWLPLQAGRLRRARATE